MSINTHRLSYKKYLLFIFNMKKKTVEVLPHNEFFVGNGVPSFFLVAVSDIEFTNPELTKSLFYRSEVTLQLDLGFKGNNNGNFVCDFKTTTTFAVANSHLNAK
jgi:hypothetical protein